MKSSLLRLTSKSSPNMEEALKHENSSVNLPTPIKSLPEIIPAFEIGRGWAE